MFIYDLALAFYAVCILIALGSTSMVQFRDAGVSKVGVKWFENKSHTDPILEDPLSGEDELMAHLLTLVGKLVPRHVYA